ncbi:hypothetical protein Acr_00g0002290 [Actinidia rufa]|uniref:Uncharacterized protein n=1 Tax=Actinidia rufa TaxID=165716 RepID=A0A7J0D6U3_9ERIC|nr:hypothetical protein Acr_00g0002290 [Actinidia rufa]
MEEFGEIGNEQVRAADTGLLITEIAQLRAMIAAMTAAQAPVMPAVQQAPVNPQPAEAAVGNVVPVVPIPVIDAVNNAPEAVRREEEKARFDSLEEEIVRNLQGDHEYGSTSLASLCLFPNLKSPTKFRPPDLTNHMLVSNKSPFSQIVAIGERVEEGLRSGKLLDQRALQALLDQPPANTNVRKMNPRKAETGMKTRDVQNLSVSDGPLPRKAMYIRPVNNKQPTNASVVQTQAPNAQAASSGFKKEPRKFTPLPMPISQLLPQLIAGGYVTPISPQVVPNPPPRWHDANAICEYHSKSPGHWTDRCFALKHRVQDLIDQKLLIFEDKPEVKPNITQNPLPAHGNANPAGPAVNMVQKGGRTLDPSCLISEPGKKMKFVFRNEVEAPMVCMVYHTRRFRPGVDAPITSWSFENESGWPIYQAYQARIDLEALQPYFEEGILSPTPYEGRIITRAPDGKPFQEGDWDTCHVKSEYCYCNICHPESFWRNLREDPFGDLARQASRTENKLTKRKKGKRGIRQDFKSNDLPYHLLDEVQSSMHSLTIEDLGSSNKGRQGQAPTMTWKRVTDPSQMIECPNDKKPEGTINMGRIPQSSKRNRLPGHRVPWTPTPRKKKDPFATRLEAVDPTIGDLGESSRPFLVTYSAPPAPFGTAKPSWGSPWDEESDAPNEDDETWEQVQHNQIAEERIQALMDQDISETFDLMNTMGWNDLISAATSVQRQVPTQYLNSQVSAWLEIPTTPEGYRQHILENYVEDPSQLIARLDEKVKVRIKKGKEPPHIAMISRSKMNSALLSDKEKMLEDALEFQRLKREEKSNSSPRN